MKEITDPSILKQLNDNTVPFDTALPTSTKQATQAVEHNPLFNFLMDAGGAIQDSLAALPFSPVPKAPLSQGMAGEIGNILGNIGQFITGGEVLDTARAATETLPVIGHLAKALSGEGISGIARRIIGTSIGGALENSDDRAGGALKGTLLGGAAESIPVLGKGLSKVPEKINPKQYTSDLANSIRQSYNKNRGQSEENYNAIMNKVGTYPVDHPNLLYPNLDKRFLRAYSSGENLLHQDYITKPTVEKANFLQSQIGHKIRELQSNPNKDPATINAIKDLSYVHGSLLSDLNSALQRIHPDISNEYQAAAEFHRNNVLPFYFPHDEQGNLELYYVTVYSSDGILQFTREGWPNTSLDNSKNEGNITNFIPNGQFLIHNNIPAQENKVAGEVTNSITTLAPGGWTFHRPEQSTAKDLVVFERFGSSVSNPTGYPRYAIRIENQLPSPGDLVKDLRISFRNVNRFASQDHYYTFGFAAQTNTGNALSVTALVIKNFGQGGSPVEEKIINRTYALTN